MSMFGVKSGPSAHCFGDAGLGGGGGGGVHPCPFASEVVKARANTRFDDR
jgi:hypothetical protein